MEFNSLIRSKGDVDQKESGYFTVGSSVGLCYVNRSNSVNLYLWNPDYSAKLSKTFSRPVTKIFSIKDLPELSLRLDDVMKSDERWFGQLLEIQMCGLYFRFGGMPYAEGLAQSEDDGGSSRVEPCKRDTGLMEIYFDKWPNTISGMRFRFSPNDHVVEEIEGEFTGGTRGIFKVHEFYNLDGTRIPKRSSVRSINEQHKSDVEKEFSWKVNDDRTDLHVEHCYTTFYRLPEPDLTGVKVERSENIILWIGCAILFVGAIVYTGRKLYAK